MADGCLASCRPENCPCPSWRTTRSEGGAGDPPSLLSPSPSRITQGCTSCRRAEANNTSCGLAQRSSCHQQQRVRAGWLFTSLTWKCTTLQSLPPGEVLGLHSPGQAQQKCWWASSQHCSAQLLSQPRQLASQRSTLPSPGNRRMSSQVGMPRNGPPSSLFPKWVSPMRKLALIVLHSPILAKYC